MLSGYHPMKEPTHPGRAHSRFGFKALLASCVVVLALGVFALAKLASLLRG